MKTYTICILLTCCLSICSCSSITVDVAVAKRELVEEHYNKHKYKLMLEELEDNNKNFFLNFYTDFNNIFVTNDILLSSDMQRLLKNTTQKVFFENNILINKAKKFLLAKDTLNFQKSINEVNNNMEIIRTEVTNGRKLLKESLKNRLKKHLTKDEEGKIDSEFEYLKNSKYILSLYSSVSSQRVRFSILGDINNSFITDKKANENLWNSTFNKNHVNTKLGHSDIAILLRGTPNSKDEIRSGDYNNNFTIKGVRLDDTDVMKAASDLLRQVVNLYSAGSVTFPNKPKTTDDNGNEIETDNVTELSAYKQNKNELDNGRYKFAEIKNILSKEIDIAKIEGMTKAELNYEIARLEKLWIKISNQTSK